jgi:nucleoid-associated protein YgaU
MTKDMLPEIFDPIELAEENIISQVEEDTLKQDLPDTFSTQLISNDTNKVGQSISEFPVDSTWAEYIILHGESLRSISQKEFGSEEYWSLIYDWNKAVLGENPALVFPYQILQLRKPTSYQIEIENDDLYIVSTGETLWSIARLIYKDEYAWSILLHDNKEKLKNPDKIYPGYPLLIRTRLVESGDEN